MPNELPPVGSPSIYENPLDRADKTNNLLSPPNTLSNCALRSDETPLPIDKVLSAFGMPSNRSHQQIDQNKMENEISEVLKDKKTNTLDQATALFLAAPLVKFFESSSTN